MSSVDPKYTNELIHESSPYLLQHAHNPVNWHPWNAEVLQSAKDQNKLILVSIGYSACHWCHVMERECFEDETVARIMNDHFICIKIDREERPDIDQVYLSAVQLMTGSGGWPLNCFTLPDGRPVYGGTYFPKPNWTNILLTLADMYKQEPEKIEEYAVKLTDAVNKVELIKSGDIEQEFDFNILHTTVDNWKPQWDNIHGGPDRAPKFPLPNNYLFLLRYAFNKEVGKEKKDEVLKHVQLTLDKMAMAGIYDQAGGGFARYSTDEKWKLPHFEKMLYDNAQLISLYCEAYQALKKPLYKDVVFHTLEFISREMTHINGAFYSALDADSEGEEGKYYVWKKEELEGILGNEYKLFAQYYRINEDAFWEYGNNILLRTKTDEVFAEEHHIKIEDLQSKISNWRTKLVAERKKRIPPGLDNKCLTSWNAMMCKAYVDAFNVFGEKRFLLNAIKNMEFILLHQLKGDEGLFHTWSPKTGQSAINGFLEDYAFTIEALLALYASTFNEAWLRVANNLARHAVKYFYDSTSGMFYFTSTVDPALITRKMEIHDNVIPASNSVMANVLFALSKYTDNKEYDTISRRMLSGVASHIASYGSGYSNWGNLMLNISSSFYEIVIVGKDVDEKKYQLNEFYIPNSIFAGSVHESEQPLMKNRHVQDKTMIYICKNNTCGLPVEETEEALKQIS